METKYIYNLEAKIYLERWPSTHLRVSVEGLALNSKLTQGEYIDFSYAPFHVGDLHIDKIAHSLAGERYPIVTASAGIPQCVGVPNDTEGLAELSSAIALMGTSKRNVSSKFSNLSYSGGEAYLCNGGWEGIALYPDFFAELNGRYLTFLTSRGISDADSSKMKNVIKAYLGLIRFEEI